MFFILSLKGRDLEPEDMTTKGETNVYTQVTERMMNVKWTVTVLVSLALLLTACKSEPEAGTPLGLAQQVATKAFETLEPTALAWGSLMPADYEPAYQSFPWEAEDSETMMRETLQSTPLVEALDGQAVKVSGYVVPLSSDEEAISEFLLVPFLGACIHVPPPPANQIVYVKPTYPLPHGDAQDVVSVAGTISAQGRTSEFGAAGYEMTDALLVPFDEEEYAGVSQGPVVVDGDGVQGDPAFR